MIPSQDEKIAVANDPGVNPNDVSRVAGTEVGGAANLDKIRDILFGGQLREVERRFARLEERLIKETNDLKEDVKRRLDALEAYARTETESLAGEIKADRTAIASLLTEMAMLTNEFRIPGVEDVGND